VYRRVFEVLVYFYLRLDENSKEYNNKEKKMTQILKLAFVLGISMLFTPANADMGPDVATKRVVKHKAKPCPTRHHFKHKAHACSLNDCEICVDLAEIERSENLEASGTLHADALYYEWVRAEAMCLAIRKREGAADLCHKCPDEAKSLIAEAEHLEYNWRHIDGCDWFPMDPCVCGIHTHHHHHHEHAHHGHCS
jgi:hypothetical protein